MTEEPGRVLTPLVAVITVERLPDDRRRLTLVCGHVVVREARMGALYSRARCSACATTPDRGRS